MKDVKERKNEYYYNVKKPVIDNIVHYNNLLKDVGMFNISKKKELKKAIENNEIILKKIEQSRIEYLKIIDDKIDIVEKMYKNKISAKENEINAKYPLPQRPKERD